MSRIKEPPLVKIFLAAFGSDPKLMDECVERMGREYLEGYLGPVDIQSPDYPMVDTDYYEKEMGPNLVKRYLSFANLLFPEHLVYLKQLAVDIERATSRANGRTVNLDPGYIFSGGLVLSTGKFSGHRLYLGKGVWGELTLHFHRGAFEAQPWTYRDYQRPEIKAILMDMRQRYQKTFLELEAKKNSSLN
ncbi:MAG: DUF4416 family protein [Deltaproteobacteria bacterium]|jgi:hypothetical protein|nr:DUF4416 family protein [Deltaproteobacteria bacterium]